MSQHSTPSMMHPHPLKLGKFVLFLAAVSAFSVSITTIEVIPEFLYDAPEQIHDLFSRMWPLEWSYTQAGLVSALIETIHTATLGTLLTLLIALPTGILAAKNCTPYAWLNWLAKLVLVSSRSINSLVWALLFVAMVGPGALAGVLAITFRSTGFVGKLFSEALETIDERPIEALRAAGASWPSIFMKGIWPQVIPAFWSIVLFRWDINIRESAVLGLVGAGGIGMALKSSMELFYWDRVGVILLTIFMVVIAAEFCVTKLRQRII